jgi:hypothetical protein
MHSCTHAHRQLCTEFYHQQGEVHINMHMVGGGQGNAFIILLFAVISPVVNLTTPLVRSQGEAYVAPEWEAQAKATAAAIDSGMIIGGRSFLENLLTITWKAEFEVVMDRWRKLDVDAGELARVELVARGIIHHINETYHQPILQALKPLYDMADAYENRDFEELAVRACAGLVAEASFGCQNGFQMERRSCCQTVVRRIVLHVAKTVVRWGVFHVIEMDEA